MRKKRVLFITEATYLNTGYATYGKEVLERLLATGKYDIAEFSIYGHEEDSRRDLIKWKNYPNAPRRDDEEGNKQYNSNPANQFGAWRFERVCLDFKPDIVIDIRDFWMSSFVKNSPYRRLFHWAWMVTCDAEPQQEEWIYYYSTVDTLSTYCDWAVNTLKRQYPGNNIFGATSPGASPYFSITDRKEAKESLGLDPECKIIGTVMRNQRRKLFPELFESFGKYLKQTGDLNTFLYCHTSYPDNGWDFPKLLWDNEISSRVLFTYVCASCGSIDISRFNDTMQQCKKCRNFSSKASDVGTGVSTENLAKIYQTFDCYVQSANSEGFGMSLAEAGACGVPVLATDYSAMSDIVRKLHGYPINVKAFYHELETGCKRAIPDTDHMVSLFKHVLSTEHDRKKISDAVSEHFNWDKTSKKWETIIDAAKVANWHVNPNYVTIPDDSKIPKFKSNEEFITWALSNYLPDKTLDKGFDANCVLRDLNFGTFRNNPLGFFYSEVSYFNRENYKQLTPGHIIQMLKSKAGFNNFWEQVRATNRMKKESWLE